MKRIAILCTCLLLLIGCSRSFPVIKGDNSIISKERNFPSYSQINLECGADIILTKGQVGNITLKASQNIEPYVITEVTNGVLTIKLSPDFSFQFTRKLELYIPVDESLSKISVSGSGDISSREQLHVKKLTCKVVGSGVIKPGQGSQDKMNPARFLGQKEKTIQQIALHFFAQGEKNFPDLFFIRKISVGVIGSQTGYSNLVSAFFGNVFMQILLRL